MGEAEGREGGLQRAERDRPVGGEEEREVHGPAAGDAEAEAQAREEGGDEGDVREGGARGGQAREQGGQGLRRQGAQGLDLSSAPSRLLQQPSVYAWICRPGGATRGYAAAGRSRSPAQAEGRGATVQ